MRDMNYVDFIKTLYPLDTDYLGKRNLDTQHIRDKWLEHIRSKNDFKGRLKAGQRNAQNLIRDLEGGYQIIE